MQDSLPSPPTPGKVERLRVALVVASLRILGGQSVQAQRLLEGWQGDPAVDAWIVPIDPVPPAPFDRLLRIKYLRTVVTQLCYWPLLFRELRRADVVHAFSASYTSFLLAPLPAVIVARLLGKPVILNYHSGEAPDHLRRSRIARFVMRDLVDANIVPSAFLRDVLLSFEIDADVVANTIDVRRFMYRSRNPLRPRLLCTRNLEPMYNVSCVLRAFGRIQSRYPDATLTVVGGGSQEAALRAEAAALQLRNVTFAGRVSPSDVASYYADADIYVQAPSIDNMPLSVLEAFASGLPVVSTNVGGVPSILRHGVDGLLVPDNADDEMAGRVLHLLGNPLLARGLAGSAHRTLSAFEWPVVREGWLRAYRRVSRRRREPLTAQPAFADGSQALGRGKPVTSAPSHPA
jgi:glycosyltransferase involved in cell wall biosynthesis